MDSDGVTILEPTCQDATSASARVSKSQLWVHIASVSLSHGIADSAWLRVA